MVVGGVHAHAKMNADDDTVRDKLLQVIHALMNENWSLKQELAKKQHSHSHGAGGDFTTYKGSVGSSETGGDSTPYQGYGAGHCKSGSYSETLKTPSEGAFAKLSNEAVCRVDKSRSSNTCWCRYKGYEDAAGDFKQHRSGGSKRTHCKRNAEACDDYNCQGHGAGGDHNYQGYGAGTAEVYSKISVENLKPCRFCAEKHIWGHRNCHAFGKRCTKCMKLNHNAKACLSMAAKENLQSQSLEDRIEASDCSKMINEKRSSESSCTFRKCETENEDMSETSDEAPRCSFEEDKNINKSQKRKARRKRCARKYKNESESKAGSEQDERTDDEETADNLQKNEDIEKDNESDHEESSDGKSIRAIEKGRSDKEKFIKEEEYTSKNSRNTDEDSDAEMESDLDTEDEEALRKICETELEEDEKYEDYEPKVLATILAYERSAEHKERRSAKTKKK